MAQKKKPCDTTKPAAVTGRYRTFRASNGLHRLWLTSCRPFLDSASDRYQAVTPSSLWRPSSTLHQTLLCWGRSSAEDPRGHSVRVRNTASWEVYQGCGEEAAHGRCFSCCSSCLNEIQVLQIASATCQRACRMLGCFKLNNDPCIVMSLYPSSAAARLEQLQGPLPMAEVISISLDILKGLAQLHAINILHLDLKPANVLLDEYGHAYLSDFGISHALTTVQACSSVHSAAGAPHYMAPEQTEAGVRGPHTDVWNFATCVLHLATGGFPYRDLTPVQMLTAMLHKKAPVVPDSLVCKASQTVPQF